MKQFSFLIVLIVLILTGCGGGGGSNSGGTKNTPPTSTSTVKPGVTDATNTAPWKNEATVTPKGDQVANAKNNIDGVNSILLIGIASSGKKNKTDIIEEVYPAPVRGSMTYKNTYTFDDVVVGDKYSYTDDTEIKFLGYEDAGFGINGTSSFNITYNQTSLNNFVYDLKGSCTTSYKDATGIFAFFMTYEDKSTMVNGVETVISTYEANDESYSSTTVYQVNGDYTYTTTYVENGIKYTSVSTYVGGSTTYEVSHLVNGQKIIDDVSSSDYTTSTDGNGVVTDIYTYSYVENGFTYTSTSTTVNGATSYVLSHIENGKVVIDSQSDSSFTTTTDANGVATDVYTSSYEEDGITYTSTTITTNGTTIYATSHIANGVVVIDSTSSSTLTTVNGVETEVYTETYVEAGVTYTYVSTTANGSTTYLTTHLANGVTVIDSQSSYSEETVNGEIVSTYIETYTVDGIVYTATTTNKNGVSTTVTTWTENGKNFTDTVVN